MPADLPRRIGFWGAAAVMVGVTIGSGIFRTPPQIAGHLDSPAIILLLWLAGGLLSLCGALTFSELACMYPQSGGIYVFLREGLGRATAFVFGWTYMLLTKPFAAAGIAVIFAEHLLLLFQVHDTPEKSWLFHIPPEHRPLAVNCIVTAGLVLLTIINVVGVGPSTRVATVLTALKVGALLAIIAVALALFKGSSANFTAGPPMQPFVYALGPVMLAILWTYDGWSDVGSIAGEVKDPQRQLPRIYLMGTAAVTALYVAVNAVYIWLVPLAEMRGQETVAPLVMQRLLGDAGGIAVTAIIMISAFGASHAAVLTGARITFAQARDGLLFSPLARIHPTRQTPDISLWVQLVMSCLAVWHTMLPIKQVSAFAQLADGFTFTMWIFYGLAGVSIFILRRTRPDAPRSYRCWGYPVIPALFVLAAFGMTGLTIYNDFGPSGSGGLRTLPWLGVLVAGLPVYLIWSRFRGPTPSQL